MPPSPRLLAMMALLGFSAPTRAPSAGANRFERFVTCTDCIAAGFGWSLQQSKCGGFSNRDCPRCWARPTAGVIEMEITAPSGLGMASMDSSAERRPFITMIMKDRPHQAYQASRCSLLRVGQELLAVNGRAVGAPGGLSGAQAVRGINAADRWPMRLTFSSEPTGLDPGPSSAPGAGVAAPAAEPVAKARRVLYPPAGPPEVGKSMHSKDWVKAAVRAQHESAVSGAEATKRDEWEVRRHALLEQLHKEPEKQKRSRHFAAERPAERRKSAEEERAARERKAMQRRQHAEYGTAMAALSAVLEQCEPVYLGPGIGWTKDVFVKSDGCRVDRTAVAAICGEEADRCMAIIREQAHMQAVEPQPPPPPPPSPLSPTAETAVDQEPEVDGDDGEGQCGSWCGGE